MSWQQKACLVCGGEMRAIENWVARCGACGFRQSTLPPGSGRGIDGLEHLRRANFKRLCDRVDVNWGDAKVLEVGCAEGWFLDEVRQRGAHCVGIEPSEEHRRIAQSKGHRVIHSFFPTNECEGKKFDVIIFNDVFEHLSDPVGALGACEKLLAPGGRLVLNLPNSNGIIYRVAESCRQMGALSLFERLWQKGFPSPHLTYFNRSNLCHFVQGRSTLVEVEYFSLPTVAINGAWRRLRSTFGIFNSVLIYVILLVSYPILLLSTPDVSVSVFRELSEE